MKPLLLIIDDDKEFINDLVLLLENEFVCISENNGENGISTFSRKSPDVILLDLMFEGGENGIEILKKIKAIDSTIPVLMITDYGSIDTAIEAIKLGAIDYISKTPNLAELNLIIKNSLKLRLQKLRSESWQNEINNNFKEIIGFSEPVMKLKEKINIYSETDNTILITGESGVGKELVARKIHALSPRNVKPFVAVNCAAIPKGLIESELFGHERGSFTGADKRRPGKFELAEDGTIFLDEIAELDLSSQVKLLRVLQEKEFNRVGGDQTLLTKARVIAATNKNLKLLVDEGTFRNDLFYRLDVLPIEVPPLRERLDDIPLLAEYFIKKACIESKKSIKKISESSIVSLKNYNWPGNIRELNNLMTRAVLLTSGDVINQASINIKIDSNQIVEEIPKTWEEMNILRKEASQKAARQVEKVFVEHLLNKFDGNISKAAEFIGINRSNLHKLIKKSLK